ncbi:MAG: endonuclease domain-containing protein [Propionibacteriaceae bacterium]|nr:endonuclease domain-containing protein [Propionibacteriaceae bacterium]
MAPTDPPEGAARHSGDYFQLPFNPELRERAKELRKAGILSEVLLWRQLSHGKFKGLDFDRQKIIGNFIVDFYCASCHAVIEVDGVTHDLKLPDDRDRDVYLEGLGLTVIHVLAKDVLKDLDGVMQMLSRHPAFGTTQGRIDHRGVARAVGFPSGEGWQSRSD